MTTDEYLASLHARTAGEYRTTLQYLELWQAAILVFAVFMDFLKSRKLSDNTIAKHVRQARTIIKNCELSYDVPPYGGEHKDYPQFTDTDFQTLYGAFYGAEYPKFIISGERHRYWHAILHFVSVTAVRRQALLGLAVGQVDFKQQFITVESAIDKKRKTRYKPITPALVSELLDLRRFYDVDKLSPCQSALLFPWTHGTKAWYKVWNMAEEKLGKRFHLHDLKRFSGELALRAGATPLELMQHMDHANITTTLKHYCRPTTTGLVKKLKVPLPDRESRMTPMFTEPELQHTLLDTMRSQLSKIGIDIDVVLDRFGIPLVGDAKPAKDYQVRTGKVVKKGGKARFS
jgi:integrase